MGLRLVNRFICAANIHTIFHINNVICHLFSHKIIPFVCNKLSGNYCFAIVNLQFIVFLFLSASRLLSEQKTMYCDRSAYYQKAIKATARRLKTNSNLLWLFLLFGRLDNFSIFHGI